VNYLDLVNKVLVESASEADELTPATWNTAQAGRRIYPRVKRNVADAWKKIQMSRDEWEFMTALFSGTIYPRLYVQNGARAAGEPAAGAIFVGRDSGFSVTLRAVVTLNGSWAAGTAEALLEFDDYTGGRMIPGEAFDEVSPVADDGVFDYIGKGTYDFLDVNEDIRDIEWTTFTAGTLSYPLRPITYIPWDNWQYNQYNFVNSSLTGPQYVSQDYAGNVAFYPQTFSPFRVTFVHTLKPQILEDWDDDVARIPEEFHDWIAWEALKMFALYDKNPTLFKYGVDNATPLMLKAERKFMPPPSYRSSPFNV
jgi:hypothetical protein